jgi:hypothetical protein
MAENEQEVAELTTKSKLEQTVEADTFYTEQEHIGKLAYKYGYVTAGLNVELMKMNETLKEVKSQLIDGGMAKDSVIIESINNRILTNIF